MNGPALIVPIRVEALPIGAPDAAGPWSVLPHANFSALSVPRAPYVGAQVFSPPFGGRPFEPGVHLHWLLPRALLAARQERGADTITLPYAPDRWLVVRTVTENSRAWVVESNRLDPDPRYSATTFPGGYLGRVHALGDWPGETDGAAHPPLNAFGYGIPDFAGCYANCRNVFGMLDAESAPGPRTYTVIGWYAEQERDPLNDADPSAFDWVAGEGPTPRRTLCFGAVSDVPFDPAAAHLRGSHAPLTPDVAIGNTPAEALAALAARRAGADAVAERLLTAFQLGALDRLGETDGIARLEEHMHASTFAAVDGGISWEVRGGVADLDGLDADQRRLDAGAAELASLRGRLFADWCRRAAVRASDRRPSLDLDALDAFMEAQAGAIEALAGELDGLAVEIQEKTARVTAALPAGARLESVPAPRYYHPTDAVVVLCGDGLPDAAPDAAGTVQCLRGDALTGAAAAGYERLAPPEIAQLAGLGPAHARPWTLPWRPVGLAWRVSVQLRRELDTRDGLDPHVVLDHFAMRADSFDLESGSVRYESLADEYSGRVLLAANASIGLERQLATALQQGRYDGLDGMLEPLQKQPLLAQSLGGFTSALGMLGHHLQLPVADPQGSPLDAEFVARVAAAVAGENRLSPLMHNPFAPLRTGHFELTELRLIDEFGRWRDVDVSDVAVAETIPTDPRRRTAVLPPLRLSQPAQLNFRWLDAGGSPILGWVVPNHLDDGLMFYDADGRALGRLTPGDAGPRWQIAPGDAPAPAGVLADLVSSLDDSAYVRAFAATLDAARALIAPPQTTADREVAVLVGSPLAIVQAAFDLSLLGLPLIDMGIDALRADIAGGDVRRRSDRALAGVRLPVLLGSLTQLGDGLAGFFVAGPDGRPDFARFLSQAATAHARIARPPQRAVTVCADPRAGAAVVTMLVDPRCEVHAYTGVLPVKTLTLPPDVVASALAALKFTFLTAPLIVPRGRVGVPIPAAPGTWSWLGGTGDPVALEPFVPTATPEPQRIADGWLQLDPS